MKIADWTAKETVRTEQRNADLTPAEKKQLEELTSDQQNADKLHPMFLRFPNFHEQAQGQQIF
jgi:hypothetical protein